MKFATCMKIVVMAIALINLTYVVIGLFLSLKEKHTIKKISVNNCQSCCTFSDIEGFQNSILLFLFRLSFLSFL